MRSPARRVAIPAPATLRTGMLGDTRFARHRVAPRRAGRAARAGARRTRHRSSSTSNATPASRRATAVDRRHRHERHGGPRRLLRARGACARTPRTTSALLDRLCADRRVRDATSKCRRDDVVHMDFSGRTTCSSTATAITGVIDWEGCDDRRRRLRPRHARLLHVRRRSATRCSTRRVPAPTSERSRCTPRT